MSKTTEALKLMTEALEMQIHGAGSIVHSKLAWQAGHEALAEPANTRSTSEYSEPVKQEPVAKVFEYALSSARQLLDYADESDGCQYGTLSTSLVRDAMEQILPALYAAPVSAKREWVDLTDYEIYHALAEVRFVRDNLLDGCRAVIAAFKEKNN